MVGEAGPRFTQRPIATPRGLKARAANISRSKKRKSGDGLGPSSVESSAEKKRKTTENDGADWAVVSDTVTAIYDDTQ